MIGSLDLAAENLGSVHGGEHEEDDVEQAAEEFLKIENDAGDGGIDGDGGMGGAATGTPEEILGQRHWPTASGLEGRTSEKRRDRIF